MKIPEWMGARKIRGYIIHNEKALHFDTVGLWYFTITFLWYTTHRW
jgi:hypothetical protein